MNIISKLVKIACRHPQNGVESDRLPGAVSFRGLLNPGEIVVSQKCVPIRELNISMPVQETVELVDKGS
jgi:hypothetical protein